MMSTNEMRSKEIINISDGRRLGYLVDFEVNITAKRIDGIYVIKDAGMSRFFSKEVELYIPWRKIIKIGEDYIMVESSYEEEDNISNE